jgi:hypothetical protein
MDAKQWLDDWATANVLVVGYIEKGGSMEQAAEDCCKAAGEAGISLTDLTAAADGDLVAYLSDYRTRDD